LPGTADATVPFWSPDGRKLGFFAADELRQIDIESGKVTTIAPRVGEPFAAGGGPLSLSPDGKSALINYAIGGSTDIGIVDLATGKLTPVSTGPESDLDQLWSNDGASVLFSSNRTVTIEMYRQQLGQPLDREKVFSRVALRRPMDMTSDGRYLFYRMNSPDLWVLDQQTKQETAIIRPGTAPTHWPRVSPDGRWIATQSHSSGSMQVHLHGPFAPPSLGTTSKPLTTNGGGWPRWRGDGEELFYVEADGTLMSISLSYSGDGSSFTASNPVKLFTAPINSSPVNTGADPLAPNLPGTRCRR
jgi:Tol biopolymer transport system component